MYCGVVIEENYTTIKKAGVLALPGEVKVKS
jgi:hypothetical protein